MKQGKMMMCVLAVMMGFIATAQVKKDDVKPYKQAIEQQMLRMEQDIEVAENVLSTLVRQQFGKRNFIPMEVEGSYIAGYGVTFRLPQSGAFTFIMRSMDFPPAIIYNDGPGGSYSYSISQSSGENEEDRVAMEMAEEDKPSKKQKLRTKAASARISGSEKDTLTASVDKKFVEISKNFLVDYGDMLSQLRPEEKIIITNRAEEFGGDFIFNFPGGKNINRTMMSVETTRGDITQYKQGKITRDQLLSRLKVVNSESADKLDPDLEVFSSMIGRLYREDLSKTYYTQGDIPYERLKDFGVIYYMRVYSSVEDGDAFIMPTIAGMEEVSQPERDKKVKEIYPKFESELKENLVEYGRTLRSLKDEEQIVINVRLTKCVQCGIPATLELSVKNSVLKDYGAGKITRDAALAKVGVKKTGVQ
ncbi:MAG: hypothetical protein WDN75_09110 [Bacteroidota bacterium]